MEQIIPSDLGSAESVLRQVRRLSHCYQLRLADIQLCPGGYLLDLSRARNIRLEQHTNSGRGHLLVDVTLDNEGIHALIPRLDAYAKYITPPRIIAVCSRFNRPQTALFLRQTVIGPALAAGFSGSDQLDIHLRETADVLKLEEAEPNSLRSNTYAKIRYGYLIRTNSELFSYLSLEPPADPEHPVVTRLGGTYLFRPIRGYGDFLATLILSPADAEEVAALFCGDDGSERAIRDLKRWHKSTQRKQKPIKP